MGGALILESGSSNRKQTRPTGITARSASFQRDSPAGETNEDLPGRGERAPIVTVTRAFFVFWLLCGSAGVASAQATESPVRRGSIHIGGNASLTRTRDIGNDHGWVTLDLTPRAGVFVAKGLAVSLNVQHHRVYYDDQATVRDQRFVGWGAGPGVTYYATTKYRRVFPFMSARTLFSRGRNEADIFAHPQDPEPAEENRLAKTRTGTWLVSGGVLYMLVKHVGITSELYYQRTRTTIVAPPPEQSNSAEQFGIQWGVAAFIF